jgi:N-methylhydantoinase A
VSLRVAAVGQLPKPQGKPSATTQSERKPTRHRKVWMGAAWREMAVWNRTQIGTDTVLAGPAVIEEAYTTVLLADGWTCRRDASGHLVARRREP